MNFFSKFVAFILIICLAPFFIIISILIYFEDGRPILFKQKRIGYQNQFFYIYKFRTMKTDTPDIATHLLESKNLITFWGKFFRKYSIDELPQLINVFNGDMVFIGARPALFNQHDLIELRTKNQIHHHKPGLTGLAQVNGRDKISIKEKVSYEIDYLNNQSLLLNFKIIFKTIFQLIFPKNISH